MKLRPYSRYFLGLTRLFATVVKGLYYKLKALASLLVNYSIYYFRRTLLGQTDQQARKMDDATYAHYLKDINARKELNELSSEETLAAQQAVSAAFTGGPLTNDNLHVNSLWIGTTLSNIELLTLQSFIKQGHKFHLWTYDKLLTKLPEGVIIEDANEILPRESIFRYNHVNKYGHGKGSVSGFSDIFRYKLLYEKGGWWIDMDVTCFKALNTTAPYFFRKHHDLDLVGNVMKCPPKSELMLSCYEEASREVNENNTDWHKPIAILNKYVFKNGLQQYIFPFISNVDDWANIVDYVVGGKPVPDAYYFIHWMNEEWRSRGINKNDFRYRSVLGQLMLEAGLIKRPWLPGAYFFNDLKHLVLLRVYYYS